MVDETQSQRLSVSFAVPGRWNVLWVCLAAILVYVSALPGGFTYDDVPVILANPATDPGAPWWEAWRRPWWSLGEWAGDTDRPYRPMTVQTFAWERKLFGDQPLPFHVLNILMHAAIGVAVWWMVRRLQGSEGAALFGGMLFVVHPIHTEAVANIVGRAELMSVGGILWAVIAYDRYLRRVAERKNGPAWRAVVSWICVLLAATVAIFSKERGLAVLPILAGWHIWSQCKSAKPSVAAQPLRHDIWWSWLKPVAPLLLIVGLYLYLRLQVSGSIYFSGQRYGPDNPLREADTIGRVLTPFALLGRYLWLMIWPDPLSCNYSVNVLQQTRSILDGYFILGLMFVIGGIAVVVKNVRRNPTWVLVIFAFASTYFLASNSVLLLETMFAERWFYGPAVWLCVAAGLIFERIKSSPAMHRVFPRPAIVIGCLGAVLAGFALRTMVRNPDWASNDILFKTDLAKMKPGRRSAHLCNLVGRAYRKSGELEKAEALLREAADIFPDYPEYYLELGKICLARQRNGQAAYWLEKAFLLQRRDSAVQRLLEIARSRLRGADLFADLAAARALARTHPDDVHVVKRWASAAEKVDIGQAAVAYRMLTTLAPDDPASWKGLGYALSSVGKIDEAHQIYLRILDRWPLDWEAHANLATLLMNAVDRKRYDPQVAIEHARRAVELKPDLDQLRLNLAEVLANCGEPLEAAAMFESFAKSSPSGSQQRILYLQRAAFLRGE